MTRRFNGFSLIEVIVSSVLVATTIGALFAAASLSTRLTVLGQERGTASQLAREGLEVVKNIRDQNFIDQKCDTPTADSLTCADWRNGILSTDELKILVDGAITKHVTMQPNGFGLDPGNLVSQTCTDYINRETLQMTQSNASADTLYCRRIFIEPVDDMDVKGSSTLENNHAIRVRSQVAWTGNGRNTLRTFNEGQIDVFNPCDPKYDEWCTEQVTILTDWRASHD